MPMSLTMTSMQMSRNSMCCQWNTLLTQDKETVSWWHDKQTYGRTWWTGNLKCNCRPAGDAGQHCQVMQVSMLTHATVFVNEGTRHWISELVMSVIPLMCNFFFYHFRKWFAQWLLRHQLQGESHWGNPQPLTRLPWAPVLHPGGSDTPLLVRVTTLGVTLSMFVCFKCVACLGPRRGCHVSDTQRILNWTDSEVIPFQLQLFWIMF